MPVIYDAQSDKDILYVIFRYSLRFCSFKGLLKNKIAIDMMTNFEKQL